MVKFYNALWFYNTLKDSFSILSMKRVGTWVLREVYLYTDPRIPEYLQLILEYALVSYLSEFGIQQYFDEEMKGVTW